MNTCINVKEKLNVGTKFLPFGDLRRGFFNEVVVPLQRHAFCFYNQFSLQFRSGGHETDLYFYHPDHIGSTSWVTDSAKNGIQYCEYLPYGEPFLDQRSTTWNSRYTFSGKERDGETGYSYFGARYYNSDISIWLSVDPLSDNTPGISPYAYCINNPIRLIDPDGQDWFENELTGAIYYNRDFTKEDVGEIGGEGWKWKGENGMFGKTDNDVLNSNISFASDWKVENSREAPITQAIFEGKGAEKFMSEMGYKQVPTQVIEYTKSNPQSTTIGSNARGTYDIGGISIVEIEKVGYVPKNYNCRDSYQIGKSLSKSTNIGFSTMSESVNRKGLTYRECSLIKGIGGAMQTIGGGKHGPNSTGGCIPNMKLVEEFKKIR